MGAGTGPETGAGTRGGTGAWSGLERGLERGRRLKWELKRGLCQAPVPAQFLAPISAPFQHMPPYPYYKVVLKWRRDGARTVGPCRPFPVPFLLSWCIIALIDLESDGLSMGQDISSSYNWNLKHMSLNEETKAKLVFMLTGNNQSSIAGEPSGCEFETKGVCEIFENKNQTRGV